MPRADEKMSSSRCARLISSPLKRRAPRCVRAGWKWSFPRSQPSLASSLDVLPGRPLLSQALLSGRTASI